MKHLNAICVLVNPHVKPVMILRDHMLFRHTRILHKPQIQFNHIKQMENLKYSDFDDRSQSHEKTY